MRRRGLRLLIPVLLSAALASAQVPRIGTIDFYGLRKVSADRVRKALPFKEGDLLPPSKAEVEEHLEEVPGIIRANLESITGKPWTTDDNAMAFFLPYKGANADPALAAIFFNGYALELRKK